MKSVFFVLLFVLLSINGWADDVTSQAPPPQVTVQVAEPAAPPKWAEDVLVSTQEIPVVGPVISKAIMYAGIVSSILTALVTFLMTVVGALTRLSTFAGLAATAMKLQQFRNSKLFYWIAYLSMFNVKKPAPKPIVIEEEKAA